MTGLSAGGATTCARLANGRARCWGDNQFGQVGDGTSGNTRLSPRNVGGSTPLVSITTISVGATHTCASRSDNTVRCWGRNDRGQVGDGTTTDRPLPKNVPGAAGATRVSAGARTSCARLASGTARCWGGGTAGQLGNGTTTDSLTPVSVTGLSDVRSIHPWASTTCAVRVTGAAVCWGFGGGGLMGDGTFADRTTPGATAVGVVDVIDLAIGPRIACALSSAGATWCWGSTRSGGFGNDEAMIYPKCRIVIV